MYIMKAKTRTIKPDASGFVQVIKEIGQKCIRLLTVTDLSVCVGCFCVHLCV